MKKISIVSPFYNELGNLELFKQRLFDALPTGVDAELVLVDDHSNG